MPTSIEDVRRRRRALSSPTSAASPSSSSRTTPAGSQDRTPAPQQNTGMGMEQVLKGMLPQTQTSTGAGGRTTTTSGLQGLLNLAQNPQQAGAASVQSTTQGPQVNLPGLPQLPGVVGGAVPGVFESAISGPSETTTNTWASSGGPMGNLMPVSQDTTRERGVTTGDIGRQLYADIGSEATARSQGRDQVLGQAQQVEDANRQAADAARAQMAGFMQGEEDRRTQIADGMGDQYERARQYADDVYRETQGAAGEQIQRAEDIREESLARLPGQLGVYMESMLGGVKNQYGQTMAAIDAALQGGDIDQAGAAQMKSQARLSQSAEVGRMASQLATQQAQLSSQLGAQIDQATLAARQSAIQTGVGAGVSAANIWGQLAMSEETGRVKAMDEERQFDLGMAQLGLTIERMQAQGMELAAEYRTATAALPSPMLLTPALTYLSNLEDQDRARELAEAGNNTQILYSMTGNAGGPPPWQPGSQSRGSSRSSTTAKPKTA